MENVILLSKHFSLKGNPTEVQECKTGHINSTYFVTTDEGEKYVIQRINTSIFKKPEEVMSNIVGVTEFLKGIIEKKGGDPERETLTVIKTNEGKSIYYNEDGAWRAYLFIKNAKSEDSVSSAEVFSMVAEAFGLFQRQLSSYDASTLYETIPNFHNTKSRFSDFLKALDENKSGRAHLCVDEIEFLKAREATCSLIVDGIESGRLPLRVTHNDTKLNNIMLDEESGKPLAVIDLDTVMPGSLLYDFGDAIRFGASSAAEDEENLDKVFCKEEMFDAFAKGYIKGLGGAATAEEIRLLPVGALVITLETGMRFLTDFLNGDTYFRVEHPMHNLVRARNQFKLVRDMEEKKELLSSIAEKYLNK